MGQPNNNSSEKNEKQPQIDEELYLSKAKINW